MLEEPPLLISGLETLGPNPRAQEMLTWAVTFRLVFSLWEGCSKYWQLEGQGVPVELALMT